MLNCIYNTLITIKKMKYKYIIHVLLLIILVSLFDINDRYIIKILILFFTSFG